MRLNVSRVLIYLIEIVIGIVELLVLGRIILKLLGASASAPFVRWIYETSQGVLSPFMGMFPSPTLEGGFVIEFSAIFGLIVYGILAYLLIELIEFVSFNSAKYRTKTVITRG